MLRDSETSGPDTRPTLHRSSNAAERQNGDVEQPSVPFWLLHHPRTFQAFMRAIAEILGCENCYAAITSVPIKPDQPLAPHDPRSALVQLCASTPEDSIACRSLDDLRYDHVTGKHFGSGFAVLGRMRIHPNAELSFFALPRRQRVSESDQPMLLRAISWLYSVTTGDADFEESRDAALIDMIKDPALLIDSEMNVIDLNDHARNLLSHKTLIRVVNGRLGLQSTAAERELESTVRNMLRHATALPRSGCNPRPANVEPVLQHYACVYLLTVGSVSGNRVIVTFPHFDELDAAARLRNVYKLSPTEERTLIGLLRGLTPAQISKAQRVSEATARTYIKRIMAKLQVRKQSEISRLALTCVPPIDLPDHRDRSEDGAAQQLTANGT